VPYQLFFAKEFVDDIQKLDHSVKVHLKNIYQKIGENPFRFKPLHGDQTSFRVRIGNYRLIYRVRGDEIHMMRFEKRDKVYK